MSEPALVQPGPAVPLSTLPAAGKGMMTASTGASAASDAPASLPDTAPDHITERLNSLVADTDLPLSQQTPWQRYEMASFGDKRPTAVARAAAEKSARIALQKQLSEQISSSREQARAEGRSDGHAEGYAEGHALGLAQGREDALAEREQWQALLSGFTHELARANELVAQDVLKLSLDLAKAMLKAALPVRPELVLHVVEDALRYLPIAQEPLLLQLHPDDAALVQAAMGSGLATGGWRLHADATLQRGGCRIETGSNTIDADIGLRWQRLVTALGETNAWLDN